MTTFHRFQIKDAPFYRNASFDFTSSPITAITGRNRNTGSSNAAGKTLFFQYLRDFLFGTDVQQDRTRDGKWAFTWSTHKGAYHAVRTATNGKEALAIKEKLKGASDWTDMGIRELRTARDFIRDSIGYNEEEFDSLVFLDTRPHPLISGNTATRKEFFTKFFRLDQQDDMAKLVNAKLSELTKLRVEFDTLTEERKNAVRSLLEIGKDLGSTEAFSSRYQTILTAHVSSHTDRLKRRLASVQKALERALRAHQHADMLKRYGSRLPSLQKLCGDDLTGYQSALDTQTRKLKRQRAELRILEQRSTIEDQIAKNEERLASVGSVSNAKAQRDALESDVAKLKLELTEATKLEARVTTKIDALTQQLDSLRKTERKYDQKVSFADFKARHADDSPTDDYDCPTCGQLVRVGDAAKHREKELARQHRKHLADNAARVDEARKTARPIKQEIDSLKDELQSVRALSATQDDLSRAEDRLNAYNDRIAQSKSITVQLKDLRSRLAELDDIDAADINALRTSTDATEDRISKLQAYRDVIEPLQQALAYVAEHGDDATDTKSLLDETHALTSKIHKLDAQTQRIDESAQTVQRLTTRIKELRDQLADDDAYKLLSKAFSKRGGVRQHQINAICQRLEQLTNQYARLIFTEDYHFTFQLDTHFNILVERNASDGSPTVKTKPMKAKNRNGPAPQKIVSDVRRLSASERKMFALVLIPALMSFIPKDRRSNLLILDEPDANMSAVVRESLVRFLPTLNRIVPNIVYITPHSDLLQLALQEGVKMAHWEVTKRGSVSTLAQRL